MGIVAQRLLEVGCEVSEASPRCQSIQSKHARARTSRGQVAAAKVLLELGPPDILQSSPLALLSSCARGTTEVFDLFVQHGADVNATDEGFTPLATAATAGSIDIVRLLLAHEAVEVTPSAPGSVDPLLRTLVVAPPNARAIVGALLEAGAAINGVSDENSFQALHLACSGDDLELDIIRDLVEAGADINAATDAWHDGDDPRGALTPLACLASRCLDFATEDIHTAAAAVGAMVGWMIDRGAEVNAGSICDNVPLFVAIDVVENTTGGVRRTDVVEALLEGGADPNFLALASAGLDPATLETPLGWALNTDDYEPLETVRLLVAHAADVNLAGDDGYTPLHHAVQHRHVGVVEFLLTRVRGLRVRWGRICLFCFVGWCV